MKSVDPGTCFASWREAAKGLLAEGIPPEEILWEKEAGLFGTIASMANGTLRVPKEFISLAQSVSCHCDAGRWALLYRILWRIAKKSERNLCAITSDPDIAKATAMRKNVSREIHKMHAFVRFRLVATDQQTGRETYAAWFEPDHWIVEAGTPFFRKRFANMDWSIFTPKGCAHWDGETLGFSEGIAENPIRDTDALEDAWRTYYRSIFNPARLKVNAMRAEMPKKYWKNLPESDLIDELVGESRRRVVTMREEDLRPAKPAPRNAYLGKLREMSEVVACSGPEEGQDLAGMRRSSASCRACPLWEHATGTVFGEGPPDARIMIVGEQPGDREDVAGRVFVGPAGKLLDRAMAEAGLKREETYLTNAVKHFKWTPKETPRGKIRLHQSPAKGEIDACRPWVLGELHEIAPEILILLGATAARSLLGKAVPVTKNRGIFEASHLARKVILTVHPSYILRLTDRGGKEDEYKRFVSDLAEAAGE